LHSSGLAAAIEQQDIIDDIEMKLTTYRTAEKRANLIIIASNLSVAAYFIPISAHIVRLMLKRIHEQFLDIIRKSRSRL
jgi:hypothetical protein